MLRRPLSTSHSSSADHHNRGVSPHSFPALELSQEEASSRLRQSADHYNKTARTLRADRHWSGFFSGTGGLVLTGFAAKTAAHAPWPANVIVPAAAGLAAHQLSRHSYGQISAPSADERNLLNKSQQLRNYADHVEAADKQGIRRS